MPAKLINEEKCEKEMDLTLSDILEKFSSISEGRIVAIWLPATEAGSWLSGSAGTEADGGFERHVPVNRAEDTGGSASCLLW